MSSSPGESTLEQRIRAVEDRFAINELVAKYCQFLDDCDIDALRGLFIEDASFGSVTGTPATGREKLLGFIVDRASSEDWSFHYPHAITIEFTSADEATGVVTQHAEMGVDGGRCIRAAMRYIDEYIRVGSGWKFKKRLVSFWYCMDLQELATGYDNAQRKRWPYVSATDLPESLETWRALHPGHPNIKD